MALDVRRRTTHRAGVHPLTPVLLAAAALLLLAGLAKLARPAPTSQALRTQGLPDRPELVRVLGAAEVVGALLALADLPLGAELVTLFYAGFTAFVAAALVRGRPMTSCGCFAEPDVPPTPVHAALTAVLAGGCALAALAPATGLPDLAAAPVSTAVAAAGTAGLVAWLSYLVMAELPRVLAELARTSLAAPAAAPAGASR